MKSDPAILFRYNQVPHASKLPIADTGHNHQVLRLAKRSVVLAVLDDSRGKGLPNAGELFQFFN